MKIDRVFVAGACAGGVLSACAMVPIVIWMSHENEYKSHLSAKVGLSLILCASTQNADERQLYVRDMIEDYSKIHASDDFAAMVVFNSIKVYPEIERSLTPTCRAWVKGIVQEFGSHQTFFLR